MSCSWQLLRGFSPSVVVGSPVRADQGSHPLSALRQQVYVILNEIFNNE